MAQGEIGCPSWAMLVVGPSFYCVFLLLFNCDTSIFAWFIFAMSQAVFVRAGLCSSHAIFNGEWTIQLMTTTIIVLHY